MGSIDHQPFVIRLINQNFQQSLPNTFISPAYKAPMSIAPITVIRRQITPRRSRAQDPENRIDKLSIVSGSAAPTPLKFNETENSSDTEDIKDAWLEIGRKIIWIKEANDSRFVLRSTYTGLTIQLRFRMPPYNAAPWIAYFSTLMS